MQIVNISVIITLVTEFDFDAYSSANDYMFYRNILCTNAYDTGVSYFS